MSDDDLPDRVMKALDRFLCFVGWHPAFCYRRGDYRRMVDNTRTCVACGRVYRDTYDGLESRWERVRWERVR